MTTTKSIFDLSFVEKSKTGFILGLHESWMNDIVARRARSERAEKWNTNFDLKENAHESSYWEEKEKKRKKRKIEFSQTTQNQINYEIKWTFSEFSYNFQKDYSFKSSGKFLISALMYFHISQKIKSENSASDRRIEVVSTNFQNSVTTWSHQESFDFIIHLSDESERIIWVMKFRFHRGERWDFLCCWVKMSRKGWRRNNLSLKWKDSTPHIPSLPRQRHNKEYSSSYSFARWRKKDLRKFLLNRRILVSISIHPVAWLSFISYSNQDIRGSVNGIGNSFHFFIFTVAVFGTHLGRWHIAAVVYGERWEGEKV